MKSVLTAIVLLAGSLLASSALAQTNPVTSNLVARRVDTVDGKQVLVPADAVKPGDLVEYATTYRNTSTRSIEKLVANVPVPTGTTFVAGSAVPAAAQASVDGTRFAAVPLTRTVRLPDGSTRQQAVPLADYRFIRWDIGTLAAGAEATVRMRVRVDSNTPPAAAKS